MAKRISPGQIEPRGILCGGHRSDDHFCPIIGDFRVAIPVLLEDFVRVFALLRRCHSGPGFEAREFDGLCQQIHLAEVLVDHRMAQTQVVDLRIREHLVDGIDRSAWYTRIIERIDQFFRTHLHRMLFERCIDRIAVLGAQFAGRKIGIVGDLVVAEQFADSHPHLVTGCGNIDKTVRRLEDTRRY